MEAPPPAHQTRGSLQKEALTIMYSTTEIKFVPWRSPPLPPPSGDIRNKFGWSPGLHFVKYRLPSFSSSLSAQLREFVLLFRLSLVLLSFFYSLYYSLFLPPLLPEMGEKEHKPVFFSEKENGICVFTNNSVLGNWSQSHIIKRNRE